MLWLEMRSKPRTVHRKIVERAFRAVGNFSHGTQDPYLKFYFGESARVQKRKEENKNDPRIVRVEERVEEESYEGKNYTHRSTRKRKRFI